MTETIWLSKGELENEMAGPVAKWRITLPQNFAVIETPADFSWWFRFWTRFFFGAKWERVSE